MRQYWLSRRQRMAKARGKGLKGSMAVEDGGRQENSLGTVRSISQVLYTNTRESCDTLKGRHKYESRVAEGPCVHEGRLEIQRRVADESLSLTADCAAVAAPQLFTVTFLLGLSTVFHAPINRHVACRKRVWSRERVWSHERVGSGERSRASVTCIFARSRAITCIDARA